jgi:hypothetical protein
MNKKKVKTKSAEVKNDNTFEVEFEKALTNTIDSALEKVFLQYNERLNALEAENTELRKKIREYTDSAYLDKTIEDKVNERVTGMKIKLSADSVVRAVERVFAENPELIKDIKLNNDNSKIKEIFIKKLDNYDEEEINDDNILNTLKDILSNDKIKTKPVSADELDMLLQKMKEKDIAKQKTSAVDENYRPIYNISDDYLEGTFK